MAVEESTRESQQKSKHSVGIKIAVRSSMSIDASINERAKRLKDQQETRWPFVNFRTITMYCKVSGRAICFPLRNQVFQGAVLCRFDCPPG
jgi:hypothetical protein